MTAQARYDALAAAALGKARVDGCTACSDLLCGDHFDPAIEDAGWEAVVERMDRWSANGYQGDWQDTRYDDPSGSATR